MNYTTELKRFCKRNESPLIALGGEKRATRRAFRHRISAPKVTKLVGGILVGYLLTFLVSAVVAFAVSRFMGIKEDIPAGNKTEKPQMIIVPEKEHMASLKKGLNR